jgi:nucleotide-binding universal stress UspA family protein
MAAAKPRHTVGGTQQGGKPMKHIVIATDGSPHAQEAVEVGLELAKEQGAEITFVHVTEPEEIHGGRGGSHAFAHEEKPGTPDAALHAAGAAADEAGVSYELEAFAGETVETIVALADSKNADLIVLGCRQRNPVASAILGSVSQGVLRRASRSVLIVKSSTAA